MLETVRGSHSCYICQTPIAWAGNLLGGLVVSHSTEIDADVTVAGAKDANNQVKLAVQIQCPDCGAVNQFNIQHSL